MSQLNQLIQKLCPNGIAYKKITDIFNMKNGYTPLKKNEAFWNSKDVPWFRMEDIRLNGRILNDAIQHVSIKAVKNKPFPANSIISTSATIGEHALITCESLANQRFTYLMLKDEYKEKFDIKFLYYYCFKIDEYCLSCLNIGNFASVDMNKFKNFEIPVPPIEVQREIVRILDTFTELIDKLNAELVARKKQYAYYRNKLLTFDGNTNFRLLGDTCHMKAGKAINVSNIFFSNSDNTLYPCYGGNGIRGYVAKASHKGEYPIIGRQGALCGNVHYATDSFYATEHAVVVKSKGCYVQRFLYYLLIALNLNQYKTQGAQPGLSVKRLENIIVPVPSLEEQERIVAILDRFDTLCNDQEKGIPAEIALRQKQYEYYRDKLLSF